jgi:hypothetical protein
MEKVSDPDLNELFQEIRAKLPNRYFLNEREIIRKRLFKRPIKTMIYTMYINEYNEAADQTGEYRCFNFPTDDKCSINPSGTRTAIMTYFYGLLGGIAITEAALLEAIKKLRENKR